MDDWVRKFRGPALAKIRECERFLAEYGIVPITGVEQEYYDFREDGSWVNKSPLERIRSAIPGSSFIEKAYIEEDNIYEIVLGKGEGKHAAEFINSRRNPSTMVRAAESARKNIKTDLGTDEKTAFDATSRKGRVRGLHINISLWDRASQTPLFPVSCGQQVGLNPLPLSCLESLLEAQHELIALNTTNPHTFKRYCDPTVKLAPKGIGAYFYDYARPKEAGASVLVRQSMNTVSGRYSSTLYLENRLSGSDVEPFIAMLVTMVGITQGVKKYLKSYHIQSPEAFRAHIASEDFKNEQLSLKPGLRPLPRQQQQAFEITKKSDLAKQWLGEEFHRQFCEEYERHINKSPLWPRSCPRGDETTR